MILSQDKGSKCSRFNWADQPLRIKGMVVVAFPLASMLTALPSIYFVERQSAAAEDYVRLTLQIQHDIQQVHTLLESAGTGVRGFLLTRDNKFLEPYDKARTELPKTLAQLRQSVSDQQQQQGLRGIEPLVKQKLEGLARMRTIGGQMQPGEQTQLIMENKDVLDHLRRGIETMRAREGQLLTERIHKADVVRRRNLRVTLVGGALGIFGSVIAMLLFSTGIVRRAHLLEENAHRLHHGEKLVPLRPAADEIGRLAHALEMASVQRSRIENSLRESEERLRLVIDGVRDFGIFALDIEGHVVSWNAGAERISGYVADEVVGTHFSLFYPQELREAKPMQELAQARRDGRVEDEGWRIRKDGSRYWANVVITAQHDESGNLRGFSKVTRDITQRMRTEEQLTRARAEAERASAAKSEFLSRMSHELRTPLNAILGYAQLMQLEQLGTSDDIRSIDHILNAGRHLLGLINEVLDIAKIESGNVALSFAAIDLTAMLAEVEALSRPLADSMQITIDSRPAVPLNCVVRADTQRLKQVLLNLVGNAIKYNHPRGRVDIAVEVIAGEGARESLRIKIQDTGIGIAKPLHARLFTPFERLGAERGRVEGTGLGLSVSRRLIEAMDGSIGLDSESGCGSTFWIDLPRMPGLITSQHRNEVTCDHLTPQITSEYRVLYIEDNESNIELIEAIVRLRPSITLTSARHGGSGILLAKSQRPDLILLDLHLPDMDGIQILTRLRSRSGTSDIPIVVVSADIAPLQQQQMLTNGATAYLAKPIDVRAFLDLIDTLRSNSHPLACETT